MPLGWMAAAMPAQAAQLYASLRLLLLCLLLCQLRLFPVGLADCLSGRCSRRCGSGGRGLLLGAGARLQLGNKLAHGQHQRLLGMNCCMGELSFWSLEHHAYS